jgi:anti-sigma-K factor RskA
MSADHQQFDELAVGWVLHALEPEDEAVFAAHLHTCERCAETVAETSDVMAAMAADLPAAEPSDELRSRLRAAVAETEQVPALQLRESAPEPAAVPAPRAVPEPARWRRALPMALAAAAVAAIAALGLWTVVLNTDRQELQDTVAAQSAVVEALSSPGRASIARLDDDGEPVATVVVREDEVQVVTSGLSVNDADETSYVLWGIGGGAPVALGTFDVEQSQTAVQTVGSGQTGLDQYDAYGISLEPGQEAPAEPSAVVASGQVTS